ncbi:MAG: ABC transporter permease [Gemmatimonadetes bacterium]|nr:ABC transporter permease [Gemmatimonadota bacterium]
MSREEARRQALISFGGVQRFKEEVRDARSFELLEDLAQDLRYALRRLTREAHGVILSASLASSLFGHDDPIGRRVRWARPSSDPDYVVVGVVGDVPSQTIRDGPSRVLYFPHLYPPKADTITNVVHD